MKLKELRCPNCGAMLVPKSPSDKIIMCEYCGTVLYLEDDDRKEFYSFEISQDEKGKTELGLIDLKSGNYLGAKMKFDEILEINPKNNIAWLGKSVAELNLGNLRASLLAFKKAIELNTAPEDVIVYGKELINTAKSHSAESIPFGHENMGNTYVTKNVVIKTYRNGVEVENGNLNNFKDFDKEINEIFNIFNKMSEFMPYTFKSSFVSEGDYSSYLKSVELVICTYVDKLIDSENIDEYEHIISYVLPLTLDIRDYKTMYKLSEILLSRAEDNTTIGKYYMGISSLYLNKPDEAAKLLYSLIPEMQNNPHVYLYLSYAYYNMGNYEYACDTLLGGYYRLRTPSILNALTNIYNTWYYYDMKSAKRWKKLKKRDLKALNIFL